MIVVGDPAALDAAAPVLARDYRARFDLRPRLWRSGAASGARLEHATD
jgi:hypothetical protein